MKLQEYCNSYHLCGSSVNMMGAESEGEFLGSIPEETALAEQRPFSDESNTDVISDNNKELRKIAKHTHN